MKTYKLLITVTEGNDEFWESLVNDNKTGCEDILESIDNALANGDATMGLDFDLRLIEFTDKE